MNRIIRKMMATLVAVATMATATAESLNQTLYFDFGAVSTTTYGETTDGVDANGNCWNNITNQPDESNKYALAGTKFEGLVNSLNAATGFSLTLNSRFSTNGKSGGGGLLTPTAENLADMAIVTATEDYYFIESSENNSNFTISGLNPDNGYKFHIFASRKAADTRTGLFTMEGVNKWAGELQLAGTNLGGTGVNQNVKTILESELVYPDAEGNITFTVSRSTGAYIALNCMKVEEYTGGTRPQERPVITAVTIAGTAAENGVSCPMHEISPDGKHAGKFQYFGMINEGTFKLQCTTAEGTSLTLGEGFAEDGDDFTPTTTGLVLMNIDMESSLITYVPITSMGLTGSVVEGGWSLTYNANLEYQGNSVWKATLDLNRISTLSDPERFIFVMNKSWTYSIKRVAGTVESVALASDGYAMEDIRLNHGRYTITLDLRDYTYTIESPDGTIDPWRISVMGSSVSNGQGATDNQGYAYMLGQLLNTRYTDGSTTNPFYTSSIAINGNNTINLLDRYNDLIHEFGRYVIYGVSLGNEGIHGAANQKQVFEQFKTNMLTLIDKARTDGKYPVVMNNYTRGDFEESDYEYVKKMNMLIHEWDVPSVNLLGAIDNGAGRWADGYQNGDDIYHPSTEGHAELFYAIVPSLFDAVAAGKEQPVRSQGNSYTLAAGKKLTFSPENVAHSFTLALTLGSAATGRVLTVATEDGTATIEIDAAGTITYTAAGGTTIAGAIDKAAEWNTITLTHYYAQGRTLLYAGTELQGEVAEKVVPQEFEIGAAASSMKLGEVMFYRSAMNAMEVEALNAGKMLKSSLELYVPFSSEADVLANYAQSHNKLTINDVSGVEALKAQGMKVTAQRGAVTIAPAGATGVTVHTTDGRLVWSGSISSAITIALPRGLYFVNNIKVAVM